MNASPVQATAELHDPDEPIRLLPVVEPEDMPPEFSDILQVQVLGYRDRLALQGGRRLRVLDPVWTLVPKDC